jgi:hypothetical protein
VQVDVPVVLLLMAPGSSVDTEGLSPAAGGWA